MVLDTARLHPALETALARGVLYDVLALSLRRPTPELLESVDHPDLLEAVADAAAYLDGLSPSPRLLAAAAAFAEALRDPDLDSIQRAHDRLFGHTARGKVPPYETEYGGVDLFRQEQDLADVRGFYRAFGLHVPSALHERSDHIAAELEFLSFLTCKEAHDILEDLADDLEAVQRTQRSFLRDHAGKFARSFGRLVKQEAGHALFEALGELCSELVLWDCNRCGVPAGPEYLPLRPDEDPAIPMACGSCPLAASDAEAAGDAGEGP
jgi:TorA maturation chaperone TorD